MYVFHLLAFSLVYLGLEKLATYATLLRQAPVFDAAELSLAFTFTTIAAMLSYRFFEYRLLKLKEHLAFIKTRPLSSV
jgi:peptidoglycan/LPS O-acetylase OafA/YrhL